MCLSLQSRLSLPKSSTNDLTTWQRWPSRQRSPQGQQPKPPPRRGLAVFLFEADFQPNVPWNRSHAFFVFKLSFGHSRLMFFGEDCTKSPISGNSLLTIFGVLAYFFGLFRNFGTVVEGRTGKTRVPEAAQRLPWLGIGEESPVQTRGSIGSRVTRTKASVASIGRASHS